MKKILIVGNGPLPTENVKSRPAAGLRTYQFFEGLRRWVDKIGFEVTLRLVKVGMPECYEQIPSLDEGFISKDDHNLKPKLQAIHDEYSPDIIIGINTYPSSLVCSLKTKAIIWSDLNGWILAEAQAQAFKTGGDSYLAHYIEMEKRVIERSDKLSTVSKAQKYAIYGELAQAGRLNHKTFGYDFTSVIVNGVEIFENEKGEERFKGLPDGKLALWLGGYNTWVDVDTLYKGVELAMEKNPDLYFVSTGGEIKGLDDMTFRRFKGMIEKSRFKERFRFLGWLETEEIPKLLRSVDLGLNIDLQCIETETGARNRINEMMKFGLPVVTTLGSEISYEVCRVGAGIGVEQGDYIALAKGILEAPKSMGEKGKKYIEEECNYEKTIAPLFEWIEKAQKAPDRGYKVKSGKLRAGCKYLRKNGLKKFLIKLWQKMSS